jgi:hypothetical protein
MREYKVIRARHNYNRLVETNMGFAIVSYPVMVAEPDAIRGINFDNDDDMFIIAHDIVDAADMLYEHITSNYTVGDINNKYPIQFNTDGCPDCKQHGIYLHGSLQDIIGYDVVYTKNNYIQEGIHNVEVTHNNYVYPALLYFWKDNLDISHGLIIFRGDSETKFVHNKYKNNVCVI